MPSTFSWVDFSDEEREKMEQIIHQLRQQGTLDELGIGSVRDSISDILFPGTTTIQTRAKYMLFVPWILIKMEDKKVPSEKIAYRVKQEEVKLCNSLLDMEFKDGVIGALAREGLKRFPSSIYWAGLKVWGIRKFRGSLNDYYQSLDRYYIMKRNRIYENDPESEYSTFIENWDKGIPEIPAQLPGNEGLNLTKGEAQYLLEKLLINCPNSLLTNIIYLQRLVENQFIWENRFVDSLSHNLKNQINHAQNFSEIILGATLIYNYMLSQQKGNQDLVSSCEKMLAEWQIKLTSRENIFLNWNLNDFWEMIHSEPSTHVPIRTKRFINRWIEIVLANIEDVLKNKKEMINLIYEREKEVKGRRARLSNREYLNNWGGMGGNPQLDYRWHVVKNIINDIVRGLKRKYA
jgi:hypothetical protein